MKLPLLISVPHAGLSVPGEAAPYCILSAAQIAEDGDGGAAEIYALEAECEAFVTTAVARAVVDLNRREDDRRRDGVVKTHTCWGAPVYDPFPPEEVVERLLERYYRPYHERLRRLAGTGLLLGIDCHTMAATGPPAGPDPGVERPLLCLGSGEGTLPRPWLEALAESLAWSFGTAPALNVPFSGGHITRIHSAEMPWVQLEISRAPVLSPAEKGSRVLAALRRLIARLA